MFEPKHISGTLLIRTLYQLINFILENESDLTLVSLGIRAAYCLLSLSIQRTDVRGETRDSIEFENKNWCVFSVFKV